MFFKYSTAVLLSVLGNVFGLTATAVNPLFEAVFRPFSMVSLSSNPGSPRLTLVSNQPFEMCKWLREISLIFLFIPLAWLEAVVLMLSVERLKSKKEISFVFESGESVFSFPVKLFYLKNTNPVTASVAFMVGKKKHSLSC